MRIADSLLKEIAANLRAKMSCSPRWSDKDLLVVTFGYGFEPHGRASETFEEVWRIELPYVQAMLQSTQGWKPCVPGVKASSSGRTLEEAAFRIMDFLHQADWQPIRTEETE